MLIKAFLHRFVMLCKFNIHITSGRICLLNPPTTVFTSFVLY